MIVDGHERLHPGAKISWPRARKYPLRALVINEDAGYTVDAARRMGAFLNVLDDTSTPVDIARLLRGGELDEIENANEWAICAPTPR